MAIQNWRMEDFLTWRWWILVALLVLPWIIWWMVVDKRKIHQLLNFGLMTIIVTGLIDVAFVELGMYIYPYKLVPFSPRLLPYVMGFLPVTYMLLYQYFPRWSSFTWALFGVGGILAFIVQPLAIAIGMYRLVNWSLIYSFMIYISVGIAFRWLTELFTKAEERSDSQTANNQINTAQTAVAKPLGDKIDSKRGGGSCV